MSRFIAAVKNDGHTLNWLLLTLGVTLPAGAYYLLRAPPQEEVDSRVKARFPEAASRAASQEEHFAALWARRNSTKMDAVYSSLLRAGASSKKRHFELTGPLGDITAAQDAGFAAERRALGGASPARAAAAPAAAAGADQAQPGAGR